MYPRDNSRQGIYKCIQEIIQDKEYINVIQEIIQVKEYIRSAQTFQARGPNFQLIVREGPPHGWLSRKTSQIMK